MIVARSKIKTQFDPKHNFSENIFSRTFSQGRDKYAFNPSTMKLATLIFANEIRMKRRIV